MFRVEWMPSGSSDPLSSARDISLLGGPSQTRSMSWLASVSNARNWRLQKTEVKTNTRYWKQYSGWDCLFAVVLCYLTMFPESTSMVQVHRRLLSYGNGYPGERILPEDSPLKRPPHSANANKNGVLDQNCKTFRLNFLKYWVHLLFCQENQNQVVGHWCFLFDLAYPNDRHTQSNFLLWKSFAVCALL